MSWISVEDKMPEAGVEVLTFSKLPNGTKKSFKTYHQGDIWYYITHWMLIPDDPKEEYDCLGDSDPS